jgi:hypothetical protein
MVKMPPGKSRLKGLRLQGILTQKSRISQKMSELQAIMADQNFG